MEYRTVEYVIIAEPCDPTLTPDQSLAAGVVASASPLVSPPTLSSRQLVNTTGDVEVPDAVNVPLTVKSLLDLPLTMVPAARVSVVSGSMMTAQSS